MFQIQCEGFFFVVPQKERLIVARSSSSAEASSSLESVEEQDFSLCGTNTGNDVTLESYDPLQNTKKSLSLYVYNE